MPPGGSRMTLPPFPETPLELMMPLLMLTLALTSMSPPMKDEETKLPLSIAPVWLVRRISPPAVLILAVVRLFVVVSLTAPPVVVRSLTLIVPVPFVWGRLAAGVGVVGVG